MTSADYSKHVDLNHTYLPLVAFGPKCLSPVRRSLKTRTRRAGRWQRSVCGCVCVGVGVGVGVCHQVREVINRTKAIFGVIGVLSC